MKTNTLMLILLGFLLFEACNPTNCPPEPLTNNDLAGYLDGSTGILFTTTADRDPVLANLNATPYEEQEGIYKMPVFKIDETQVYLLFGVKEVDNPSLFINFHPTDICYNQLFQDFEDELKEMIDKNDKNIADKFVIACGELAGKLAIKEKAKKKSIKGEEKETIDKLKKIDEKIKSLINNLAEKGRKKGEEAKEKIKGGDKEGAKQKAKELRDETQQEFHLDFGYGNFDNWNFGFNYGKYWYSPQTALPPDLIKEFSKDNIRYKVYKNAKCGPGPPTLALDCYKYQIIDSTSTSTPPPVWVTEEYLPRKVCERGSGFCVEQEVVIELIKEYDDDSCRRLINVTPVKDFACFD